MNNVEDLSGKRVIVGLTGRLASGVTAFLLKKQGMDVIGVSIVTNSNENFSSPKHYPKCHIRDLNKLKHFCDDLGIPFYATDGMSEYETQVFDNLVSNKLSAKANVSCFNCSQYKIKILYEKMKKLKADFISTGHFCKIHKNTNTDLFYVHANNDAASDQSFLLAGLEDKFLRHLILPLGDLRILEVQKIAEKFSLDLDPPIDSRDFCYKNVESYIGLLEKKIPSSLIREGQVQDIDTDTHHGEHKGIMYHYMTQKNLEFDGIKSSESDLQVVGYNFNEAVLEIGDKVHLTYKCCQLVNLKLGAGLDLSRPIECFLKNKYSMDYLACKVFFKNNDTALVEFEKDIYPLIEGEVMVLFDRNSRNAKVIGSGNVAKRGDFNLIDRVEGFRSQFDENAHIPKVKMFKF